MYRYRNEYILFRVDGHHTIESAIYAVKSAIENNIKTEEHTRDIQINIPFELLGFDRDNTTDMLEYEVCSNDSLLLKIKEILPDSQEIDLSIFSKFKEIIDYLNDLRFEIDKTILIIDSYDQTNIIKYESYVSVRITTNFVTFNIFDSYDIVDCIEETLEYDEPPFMLGRFIINNNSNPLYLNYLHNQDKLNSLFNKFWIIDGQNYWECCRSNANEIVDNIYTSDAFFIPVMVKIH